MRLEDIKQEFPKMPEDMRAMVEREVERQLKQTAVAKHSDRNVGRKQMIKRQQWSVGKAAAVALVATMVLGTTVFAGVKLYQMHSEQEGNYGLITRIENMENTEENVQTAENMDIPMVKMEATYLPEGMAAMEEEGIYCYTDTPYQGGFSVFFYRMNQGDDAFKILDKGVTSSEEISLGGHDGIYFAKQSIEGNTIQHIYLSYPEVHYVLDLYIGEDVPKEEALKFAEGIRLTPTEDEAEMAKVRVEDWSLALEREEENAALEEGAGEEETELWTSISREELDAHTHAVGESFSLYRENGIGGMPEHDFVGLLYPGLEAKVTDVKVTDNLLSVLPAESIRGEMRTYMAEDGTILPLDMNYVKYGDGIDTINTVVKTEQVTPKFVYITVEYTNNGQEVIDDILVNSALMTLQENGGTVEICDWEPKEGMGTEWDAYCQASSHLMGLGVTPFFELTAEKTEKNHIIDMKPGETATLQAGFYVKEEMLPYLYLNIDPYSVWSEFSDTGLDVGYIDIRQ